MEKLRIKYSEMYTIVPAEMDAQVEECRKALEDLEEKVTVTFAECYYLWRWMNREEMSLDVLFPLP